MGEMCDASRAVLCGGGAGPLAAVLCDAERMVRSVLCDAGGRAWVAALGTLLALVLGVVLARSTRRAAVKSQGVAAASTPRLGARKVVLLGSEQSGKTGLFMRLALGVAPNTVTTQRVSQAAIAPGSACVHAVELVDVPGHARLRARAADYVAGADALVFCVDASVASRGGSEAAVAAATLKRTKLHDALIDSVECVQLGCADAATCTRHCVR